MGAAQVAESSYPGATHNWKVLPPDRLWASRWSGGKEPTCQGRDLRDAGSIPGLGRSPGGGNDNPLQYSCLGNPMDRGA